MAENNGLNEISEENGGAEVETEEEDDQQPSVVISKSQEPVDSSTTSPLASIRKRFAGKPFGSTSGGSGQEGVSRGLRSMMNETNVKLNFQKLCVVIT